MTCIMYKAIYLGQVQLFGNNIVFLEPRLRRGDIRQDYLKLPVSRLVKYEKSFIMSAIRVWNLLPPSRTNLLSFGEFREACYGHFIRIQNNN